ncbi:MAG: metallophosphoesterase [Trueperaceae bacterium]|nr:metallophosphoesterase [Trueperaceae bacterium]
MKPLRIAMVADVHCGEDQGTKLGSRAPDLLPAALAEIARHRPDLVVDLGDRINQADAAKDARNLRRVAEMFAALATPRVHLVGNHDVDNLSVAEHEQVLGHGLRHHSRNEGGWHLTFWNPDCRYVPKLGNMRLSDGDLAWLEADLAAHDAPTVLFSHAPAHRAPMDGNLYFEHRPASRAWHANVHEATQLLARHRQVILCVNGHTHWNALSFLDGIAFATLPSLTECFTTPPEPSGAWGLLELADPITWTVRGRDPLHWSLPLRHPRRGWSSRGTEAVPSDPADDR